MPTTDDGSAAHHTQDARFPTTSVITIAVWAPLVWSAFVAVNWTGAVVPPVKVIVTGVTMLLAVVTAVFGLGRWPSRAGAGASGRSGRPP